MTTIGAPIAATAPATAATPAYVRTAPAPSLAPPLTSVGWLGWVRAHLFENAVSTVLTILIVLLLVLIVPPVIDFLFVDAVWSGSDREACLPTAARPEVGACWAFIGDRFAYTIYGSYPIAARWRVDVFFGLLGFGMAWLLWLEAPRRDLGSIYFFSVLPVLAFVLLHGAPAIGLPVVDTALWGGMLVTIVVAAVGIVVSLPIGIVLALGRRSQMPAIRLLSTLFIEFVRGVPLITVLFMASVMLPLFLPETASRCSPRPTWPKWFALACNPCKRANMTPPMRSASATGSRCATSSCRRRSR
jgi:general L-amino acid transport system permease protein